MMKRAGFSGYYTLGQIRHCRTAIITALVTEEAFSDSRRLTGLV